MGRTLALLLALGAVAPNAILAGVDPAVTSAAIVREDPWGRWVGAVPVPGRVELEPIELQLELDAENGVRANLNADGDAFALTGAWDAAKRTLVLEGRMGSDPLLVSLQLEGTGLVGTLTLAGPELDIALRRPSATDTAVAPIVVDFSIERPRTVSVAGLAPELAKRASSAIVSVVESTNVVGLSAAFVVEGELVDVRSFGWEDFPERVPASEKTMYRWASISKPLTAVVALQLADEGKLDFDRDVREYVPEFPAKRFAVTPRQLLCHQSGVAHYQHMKVRTLRDYDVAHPWADRIIALDMFKESDLLFEPGTQYSYTTPGYALLGAVLQRTGGARYAELVKKRVCAPLGMTTMQPDYQWVDIPHRSRGYHREGERVVDSGDDDISWKLPAGGWISTVGDLARFAAGLMGSELLAVEQQVDMWTAQRLSSGAGTNMGLGIGIGRVGDTLTVSHSGGQKKTSTYMLACPERGLAVALMCNTQGTGLSDLAQELMAMLIEHQDG